MSSYNRQSPDDVADGIASDVAGAIPVTRRLSADHGTFASPDENGIPNRSANASAGGSAYSASQHRLAASTPGVAAGALVNFPTAGVEPEPRRSPPDRMLSGARGSPVTGVIQQQQQQQPMARQQRPHQHRRAMSVSAVGACQGGSDGPGWDMGMDMGGNASMAEEFGRGVGAGSATAAGTPAGSTRPGRGRGAGGSHIAVSPRGAPPYTGMARGGGVGGRMGKAQSMVAGRGPQARAQPGGSAGGALGSAGMDPVRYAGLGIGASGSGSPNQMPGGVPSQTGAGAPWQSNRSISFDGPRGDNPNKPTPGSFPRSNTTPLPGQLPPGGGAGGGGSPSGGMRGGGGGGAGVGGGGMGAGMGIEEHEMEGLDVEGEVMVGGIGAAVSPQQQLQQQQHLQVQHLQQQQQLQQQSPRRPVHRRTVSTPPENLVPAAAAARGGFGVSAASSAAPAAAAGMRGAGGAPGASEMAQKQQQQQRKVQSPLQGQVRRPNSALPIQQGYHQHQQHHQQEGFDQLQLGHESNLSDDFDDESDDDDDDDHGDAAIATPLRAVQPRSLSVGGSTGDGYGRGAARAGGMGAAGGGGKAGAVAGIGSEFGGFHGSADASSAGFSGAHGMQGPHGPHGTHGTHGMQGVQSPRTGPRSPRMSGFTAAGNARQGFLVQQGGGVPPVSPRRVASAGTGRIGGVGAAASTAAAAAAAAGGGGGGVAAGGMPPRSPRGVAFPLSASTPPAVHPFFSSPTRSFNSPTRSLGSPSHSPLGYSRRFGSFVERSTRRRTENEWFDHSGHVPSSAASHAAAGRAGASFAAGAAGAGGGAGAGGFGGSFAGAGAVLVTSLLLRGMWSGGSGACRWALLLGTPRGG
ncbi:hypothetical protein CLOP_g2989 [Closterium sp. NIES-67]|nr:hypothetical protein CLOP_g2989 [Closterium sp. NIES-67]